MPNFKFIGKTVLKSSPTKRKFYRDFKIFDSNKFLTDSTTINLTQLVQSRYSTNDKYNIFQESMINIVDQNAPLKQISRRMQRKFKKPWITSGIINSIKVKNSYYKHFVKTLDPFWYKRYKYFRDMIDHLIRKSKRINYMDYII